MFLRGQHIQYLERYHRKGNAANFDKQTVTVDALNATGSLPRLMFVHALFCWDG